MDDFSTVQSNVQSSLVSITRAASALASEDLPFHRSLSSDLASTLDQQNERLLGLASGLMATATSAEEPVRAAPSLKDLDAVDGNWRAVVDLVDSLLERADTALDEFTGAVKRLSPGLAEKINSSKTPPKMSKIATQLKAQDMEKPQLLFDHVPTNQEEGPFKPLLLSKPHAIAPLETEPIATDELSQQQYPHPYQLEIEQYRYPSSVYTQADPIPYHPFESTTATLVDSEAAVEEMLQQLKQAKEIAIDLEHHDQRSYVGIVSLMQISTRDRDWIVDTLKPWRRKLQCLNEVFADPTILKILHGAYMDIVWLQRDLGLYLVGLFDTHYAARALGYPGGSLAFLLKKFANVDAQKQYQMADWRVRPLPKELFDYARSDTHYLLYIYDCMRNELIQRSNFSIPNQEGDKLWDVLYKSSEIALQRYEHPTYDAELGQGSMGWYKMLSRTSTLLTREQFAVFRAVHQWRDAVAREQDDSVHYVIPNHQLWSLAREMPTNRAAVLGIAQPTTQTVRLRVDELVAVIWKAKVEGKNGMELVDVLKRFEPQREGHAVTNAKEPSPAVTNFVPKNASVANGTLTTDVLPLRSAKSAFWGNAFESSIHHQQRTMTTAAGNISLSVPMPTLTAEVFADPAEVESPTVLRSSLPAQDQYDDSSSAQQPDEDDVFVHKDLSRKRKRQRSGLEEEDVAVDGTTKSRENGALSHSQDDERSASDEEMKRMRDKIAKKMAKKEAKRAAKIELAREGISTYDDAEPFDYASAPSILNPPREDGGGLKDNRKKQVDPYRKSLDTPKGLPRTQKERAGKSMSYKS